MSPIFKSGAFVQQCFASHRLCLSVKKIDADHRILLACSSCTLLHRLTLRGLTSHIAAADLSVEAETAEMTARDRFVQCFTAHGASLAVREMDVVQEAVRLRCAECRRAYDLDVSSFETHQK